MVSLVRGIALAMAISSGGLGATREAEARAAAWMKAWDSQGVHRTGTNGDEAGAAWLAREAEAIVGGVESETFSFERIDTVAAFVEFEGVKIEGEPFLDGPSTGANGVRGVAGDAESGAPVAVLRLHPSAVYGPEFAQMRRASRHAAHVMVTLGGAPGLALLNAEWFRAPFGPPTLQVSSVDGDRIAAAVARKAEMRVVVHTKRIPAQARNVVVTIPGKNRTRSPVVVMTPRSSWWQSTSERGGGIVCWLESLRALQANPPACDVVFTANTGHELGHTGLDDFVARRPGWETKATWVHYGANIAAAGSKLTLMAPNDELRALAVTHLTAAGKAPDILAEKTNVPTGETKDIHKAGGRYLTLVGPPSTSALFHLPQDRWPHAVDVPTVARVAAGMAEAVIALTR